MTGCGGVRSRVMSALIAALTFGKSSASVAQTRRAAVAIFPASQAAQPLADNLTELALAQVAQRGYEVVGIEEFRARLGAAGDREAQACIEDSACLGRAAVELAVTKILSGSIAVEKNQYLFHLALRDATKGAVENRIFRLVEGPVGELVSSFQEATDAVFRPRPEPSRIHVDSDPPAARVYVDNVFLGVTPLLSPEILSGRHRLRVESDGRFPWVTTVEVPPSERLEIRLTKANLTRRRSWPVHVAWGAAVGGAVTLGGGVLLGALSQTEPSAATRAEAMRDLERREALGRLATAMVVSSAALAAVALFHLLHYRDEIFGQGR